MKVHVVTKTTFIPNGNGKNITAVFGAYSSKKKAVAAVDERLNESVDVLQKYGYSRRDTVVLGISTWGYDLVDQNGGLRSRYVIETMEVE